MAVNGKYFPDERAKADLLSFELIDGQEQIVDEFNFVLIDAFGSLVGFSDQWPEDTDKIGLGNVIAHSECVDGLLEVGGDDDEEGDYIFVGAGVPVGLLREVGQEADDEVVGNFEELDDIGLGGVLKQPKGDGVDEVIEVADCGGVDPFPLVVFEGRVDDEHLNGGRGYLVGGGVVVVTIFFTHLIINKRKSPG